jgi:DUF4097 and DUF4098 domain-containing protein YvlB
MDTNLASLLGVVKMKYSGSLLALTLGFCCSVPALAGQKVDEILDASSDGRVEIEHVTGNAQIKGWDKDKVKVVGELDDRAEDFIFKRNGNNIRIEVEMPNRLRNSSRHDGDILTIWVPENSRVRYSSINAEVEIKGVHGGVEAETINGGIDAEDLKGRIRLESVNGDIETQSLAGAVKIETVNGDIDDSGSKGDKIFLNSVNGDIDMASEISDVSIETVNGNMDLMLKDIEALSLDTVNGDVDSQLNLMKSGGVRANSIGGDIDLYFQSDVSARFEIQSHAGGSIRNNLSDDKMRRAKYGPRRWLEFSLNGGDASVDVSTVGGDVTLSER